MHFETQIFENYYHAYSVIKKSTYFLHPRKEESEHESYVKSYENEQFWKLQPVPE